jgi:hypothetical protein
MKWASYLPVKRPRRHMADMARFAISAPEPWILKFGPCRPAFAASSRFSDIRALARCLRAPSMVVT